MGLLPVTEAAPGEDDRLIWRSTSPASAPVEGKCHTLDAYTLARSALIMLRLELGDLKLAGRDWYGRRW
jgi:hypothetical protein